MWPSLVTTPLLCIGTEYLASERSRHYSTLYWSRFSHAHDILFKNLFNSLSGCIDRMSKDNKHENNSVVVPLDVPASDWGSYQQEKLQRPYSWLSVLFSLCNITSFSALRACITKNNDFVLSRLEELSSLSKPFKQMLELLSVCDTMLRELYGLWGECNTIPNTFSSWFEEIASIRNTRNLPNKARNVKSLTKFTTHPFPFELSRCKLINNYKSTSGDTMSYKEVILRIYDTMLSLQSLDGRTSQTPLTQLNTDKRRYNTKTPSTSVATKTVIKPSQPVVTNRFTGNTTLIIHGYPLLTPSSNLNNHASIDMDSLQHIPHNGTTHTPEEPHETDP